MKDKRRNLITVSAVLMIVLVSVVYKVFFKGIAPDEGVIVVTDKAQDETEGTKQSAMAISESRMEEETSGPEDISIYLCGEVTAPGVYTIERGAILNDVVIMAGGLTDDAAKDRIDLVRILDKNMSIYVPKDGEEYIDKEGIIRQEGSNVRVESPDEETGRQDPKSEEGGKVNINKATIDELMTLPGVGEATARAIAEYREKTVFEKVEDIMNISGIGKAKFERLKEKICV